MIITIDGPAATGKGTISARIAEKYKLAYFDTGMVYRAVGLQMLLNGDDLENQESALKIAQNLTFPQMIELSKHADFRSDAGSHAASVVSSYAEVRKALLAMQQNFAKNPVFADGSPAQGVIYDGRDTGTVVCPDADVKVFIDASPEVRAQRRYKDYLAKGINADYNQVLAQMIERDKRDRTRSAAPLKPADDAIILDNSHNTVEDDVAFVSALIDEKLNSKR